MAIPKLDATYRDAGRARILGILLATAIVIIPWPAQAEVAPIVKAMLENLAALDEIGEGIALDDFGRIERAANDLEARAGRLLTFDITAIGAPAGRDGEFDTYLRSQQVNARAIAQAASGGDAELVARGVERLLNESCLTCHLSFRRRENRMRPAVLLMATFLDAWRDMNRGLLTDDLALVAQQAHELQIIGRVFTWDKVIETTFGIAEPERRAEFRMLLGHVLARARQIEQAANEEKPRDIVAATRAMWTDGCIACHAKFRTGN